MKQLLMSLCGVKEGREGILPSRSLFGRLMKLFEALQFALVINNEVCSCHKIQSSSSSSNPISRFETKRHQRMLRQQAPEWRGLAESGNE
jgi:hypothetical protein